MLMTHLPPQPIPLCVTLAVAVAASTDLVARRVPNLLIAVGLIASLAVQICLFGFLPGVVHWFEGVLTGFALLLPVYLLGGMAAGDVKLLMMVGGWVGPEATVSIALVTFITGGVWALVVAVIRGRLMRLISNVAYLFGTLLNTGRSLRSLDNMPIESVGTIPYAAAIATGTVGMLWYMAN